MLNDIPEKRVPKFEPDGGALARAPKQTNSIRFAAPAPMALVMFAPQPDRETALEGESATSGMAPAGSLEIIPAHAELHAPWNVEKQNLLLAVDSKRLERLVGVEFNRETFELHPPKLALVDSKAHRLARWIRSEVENKGLSWNECVDALITVFAAHLVTNHPSVQNRSIRHSGGLPPAIWRRVDDFINGNLSDSLTLKRLARVARLSPSHFARAFKQTSGQSAHQYVISARLAHARNLITSTDRPLSQIAKMAGFSSNSHMTTLMRRAWHCTPTDLRKRR
ncbi:helix-turn-helix domain-containing protein [Devosia nitrariae]|uniref:AraC family transcriptional regulator n=1 Tax=Devosia nitrariae TaxID=2071872 RepID=A0ABQ5W6Q8_9HYPH|nr:AraC family transcriptional regulator [Devosia nitrariae]GLQ55463.1 AraC family transcriptional regulator [Devosia nitrariae]